MGQPDLCAGTGAYLSLLPGESPATIRAHISERFYVLGTETGDYAANGRASWLLVNAVLAKPKDVSSEPPKILLRHNSA